MIAAFMVVLGLGFGSFINALVWRMHMQEDLTKKQTAKAKAGSKKSVTGKDRAKLSGKDLSISKGRSMCPHCHHTLSPIDLIPVLSWVMLDGKCRYCRRPISKQYPLVELLTAILFVVSYLVWPYGFEGAGMARFTVWLIMIVGFIALAVYDLRWMILPNQIVYPLIALAVLHVLVQSVVFDGGTNAIREAVLGLVVGGGIFYLLFQFSKGRWIGGGDVKIGFLFGLLVGGPFKALLVLFLASALGTLYLIPMLLLGKVSRRSRVPFGPFLLSATFIVTLWGQKIVDWYMGLILG